MQQISSGVLSGGQNVPRPAVAPRNSPSPFKFLSSTSTSTLPHRSLVQICNAGFSSGSSGSSPSSDKKSNKKKARITRYLDVEDGSPQQSAEEFSGWIEMPDIDAIQSFVSKPIKPIILATGKAICLYKVGEQIFCSDANSTAYQYPLADANILGLKTGPAVESKLDGTVYDLATGRVMSWCPKNTPVRGFLGALKNKSEPIDLPIYPTKVEGRKVFVKLAKN
ncbi:hypothetical protein Ndes2526B_g05006 [Nannochloris sp. 'desiccata']